MKNNYVNFLKHNELIKFKKNCIGSLSSLKNIMDQYKINLNWYEEKILKMIKGILLQIKNNIEETVLLVDQILKEIENNILKNLMTKMFNYEKDLRLILNLLTEYIQVINNNVIDCFE